TSPTKRNWRSQSPAANGGALPVLLVEGQPVQGHPVGGGLVDLLKGDLPLGAMHQVVGDAGGPAAGAIIGPPLGQEQRAAEQGLEAAAADAYVDGDNTVVGLAQAAAPLAGDPRGLGALLGLAGLVDDADGAQASVIGQARQQAGGVAVQDVEGPGVVPGVVAQELLEGTHRGACGQGDGLDRLAVEVGEQPADVGAQVVEGLGVLTAEQEAVQEAVQGTAQAAQLAFAHRTEGWWRGLVFGLPSFYDYSSPRTRPLAL